MDWVALRRKATQIGGKYRYVLLILLIGVCLMLIPDFSSKEKKQETAPQIQESAPSLRQELEEILCQVKGAGKVSVMLTVDEGEHIRYQTDDTYNGADSQKHDTVIITDENRAQSGLVQQVNPPKYRGAVVVCQGADSAAVRLAIIEAVSKVTGLDSSRISILKMK